MIARIGLAALVILVVSETFAFTEAALWAIAAFARLGDMALNVTFVFSAVVSLAAGVAIFRLAARQPE